MDKKLEKTMVGLAGEMRVCSELLKRGYQASITFGNAKATDIVIVGEGNRFLRVEVKTSRNGKRFVTGYYPKYTDRKKVHPDIWVFYLPNPVLTNGDRFFIVTHEEVGKIQLIVNKGHKTLLGKGCDNIPLKLLEEKEVEDNWGIVKNLLPR